MYKGTIDTYIYVYIYTVYYKWVCLKMEQPSKSIVTHFLGGVQDAEASSNSCNQRQRNGSTSDGHVSRSHTSNCHF